jgi:glucosamine-6-phosphate deaminase
VTFRLRVIEDTVWPGEVAYLLAERIRQRPDLRLCLPTGDTPSPAYRVLARSAARGEISLERATVILLDEYLGLPVDDPGRLDRRLRRDLLDRLPSPPAAWHPVPVDDLAPEDAAAAHDRVAAVGIDLALVGLGLNGHVGLNEPGSESAAPTRVVDLALASRSAATERYGAAAAPTRGITLGMDRLLAAREVWLLVTGSHKADVLRSVLREVEGPERPASLLMAHPHLLVLADASAAQRLV